MSQKESKIDPKNRSVAQPLPGTDIPDVKERAEASEEDKQKALEKHSKLKKQYPDDGKED
jgi:NACalpha-BTF3-like transcription factor